MTEKCTNCGGKTLFLLGVLVGAILVGSLFFYRMYLAETGGANLLRGLKITTSPLYSTTTLTTTTSPISAGDPQPWAPVAAGDPQPW